VEAWADQEGATVVWVDESAFSLLPGVVRTSAPTGRTPILKLPLTRDHLSAISGITKGGRLFLRLQDRAYRSTEVVEFLRQLLRCLRGKLLVIWDGAPIHRSQAIKDFLAQGAAKRLRLEALPGYAPELNPDEGIWTYLKHVELRTVRCQDLDHLYDELTRAAKRLRHKRRVIRGCFRQCGYAV